MNREKDSFFESFTDSPPQLGTPTNHEVLMKELHYKKPILNKLYKQIIRYGTVTGSFIFGGWKEGSDIDYIISNRDIDQQDFSDYFVYAIDDYPGDGSYFSFYVKTNTNLKLNILVMGDSSILNTWVKATKIMLKLKKIPLLNKAFRTKKYRVKMFELLKEICE